MQVWSPASSRLRDHFWPPGLASFWRSFAHSSAKPSLKMPPGRSVPRPVSEMTESGVIALRWGGFSWAVKSWLMPGYEIPTMPTLWPFTQSWAAIVSTTS